MNVLCGKMVPSNNAVVFWAKVNEAPFIIVDHSAAESPHSLFIVGVIGTDFSIHVSIDQKHVMRLYFGECSL